MKDKEKHHGDTVCMIVNTLLTGGAEKQSLYLLSSLSDFYNVTMYVYHGDQVDLSMKKYSDDQWENIVFLKGNHLQKLIYIYKIFRQNREAVVISYLFKPNLINAIVGYLTGVEIRIGGIRSSKIAPVKKVIGKWIHNHLLSASIINNLKGKNDLVSFGYKEPHLHVIYNDLGPVNVKKSMGNVETPVTLLTVGRFEKVKDYTTALKAIKKLREELGEDIQFKYVIVGYGQLKMYLSKLISEYDLENIVEIVIKPKDINRYYEEADIYLSTSLFEGMSNSILEAIVHKLPVVATKVGDNDQIVLDGISGYLVPVKGVTEISKYLNELICDHKKREQFGENGFEVITEKLSRERSQSDHLELIKNLKGEEKN